MKKNKFSVDKQVKKSYKRFKSSRFFIPVVVVLVIAFAVYVFIPEHDNADLVSPALDGDIRYAIPSSPYKEQRVDHKAYSLGYNEDTEQPNWVAYVLTKDHLMAPESGRTEDFREDFSVLTGSASLDDYRSSGYDRGHLAPAADFKWNTDAMSETFYMSNMSPQEKEFNRGKWADLESAVRLNAYYDETLYVTTGPIFYKDKPVKRIGKNKVAVPHAYYKALMVANEGDEKAIGFVLPNENLTSPLVSYTMSIDELENITGLDFFPELSDDIENRIEANFNVGDWQYGKFKSPDSDGSFTPPVKNSDSSFENTKREFRNLKRSIRSALGLK